MQTVYTAIVQKKVKSSIPVLNGKGKPVLVDPNGKSLPVNEETGEQVGTGTPKLEQITTDTTDDPLTDEAGNMVEAGTEEALLRKVKEHFADDENTTVLHVTVRKTETSREVSEEDLAKVK